MAIVFMIFVGGGLCFPLALAPRIDLHCFVFARSHWCDQEQGVWDGAQRPAARARDRGGHRGLDPPPGGGVAQEQGSSPRKVRAEVRGAARDRAQAHHPHRTRPQDQLRRLVAGASEGADASHQGPDHRAPKLAQTVTWQSESGHTAPSESESQDWIRASVRVGSCREHPF